MRPLGTGRSLAPRDPRSGPSIAAEFAWELWQDLTYAARVYRRRALSTALAVAALALAIGGPRASMPTGKARMGLAVKPGFEIARYRSSDMSLRRAGQAARVRVIRTTANFFGLAGRRTGVRQSLQREEDVPGKDAVAVFGYGLWQQMFGGDAHVLEATIHVNGSPLTVVGVAPPPFDYPANTAIWTPTVFDLGHLGEDAPFTLITIVSERRCRRGDSFAPGVAEFRPARASGTRRPRSGETRNDRASARTSRTKTLRRIANLSRCSQPPLPDRMTRPLSKLCAEPFLHSTFHLPRRRPGPLRRL